MTIEARQIQETLYSYAVKNAHDFGGWNLESLDDVRHSLYNYYAYQITLTTIIMYIICDVFSALLHGLITKYGG